MTKPTFNLLDEPWIIATNLEGIEETLSLTDVLVRSHELKSLSGEMPSQDIAIMRLLLGVLYAIYTRTEEYEDAGEDDAGKCIEVWRKLWERKFFAANEISDYLRQYHDRFWLVHPERPFYQVAEIKKGSDFTVSKMIGELVEGGNKIQLFPIRSGKNKQLLDYPEAARWLLYLNSFDDASAKPTQKGLDPMSVGWLGQLGIVYVAGSNLFETLMLNFSLLNNGKPWGYGNATWELEASRTGERTLISMPNSGEELYTLQSRRIQLKYDGNKVIGFTLLGGDKFSNEDAFVEPMTIWKFNKGKAGVKSSFLPPSNAARNPAKQLWRDFSSLLVMSEQGNKANEHRDPGILRWISELEGRGIIASMQIQICTMAIKYGNMQSGVEEVWSDALSVNASLLSALGEVWIGRITDLVGLTEDLVKILGSLASNIVLCTGSADGKTLRDISQEQAYASLDIPFRNWLSAIDPKTSDIICEYDKWVEIAKKIILDHGENLVSQAGTQAFIGRNIKIGNREDYYSTPKVYGWFRRSMHIKLSGIEQTITRKSSFDDTDKSNSSLASDGITRNGRIGGEK